MLTKKRRVIYGIGAMVVVAIVGVVLLLKYVLPKDEILTITSKDFTMATGEEKKIEYVVSNPYAIVKVEIEDEAMLEVANFKVTALKEGKTKIAIVAKYREEIAECVCEITVVKGTNDEEMEGDDKKEENPSDPEEVKPDPPTEPETPPEEEKPENPKEEEEDPNKPEDKDPPTVGDEIKEVKFELISEFKCEVEGKVLKLKRETDGHFMIEFEEEINGIELEGEKGIEIRPSIFGGNIWTVRAEINGKVKIKLNGQEVGNFEIMLVE